MREEKPVLLRPDRPCEHKKLRIYTEKRDGKLVPSVVRCFSCGAELQSRIVLVTPEEAQRIPPGAQVVMGRPEPGAGPFPLKGK